MSERRGVQVVARVAVCPEHGLHGERDRCFECNRPARRPVYVSARWLAPIVVGAFFAGCVVWRGGSDAGSIAQRVYWFRHDRLCRRLGWHWPIKWDTEAHPGSFDPPQPPEPDWCCAVCGYIRAPYRAWWWRLQDWRFERKEAKP